MSGVATSPSFKKVVTTTGSLLWSVTARRLRRRLLTAKAPALVKSVAARSSDALRSAASARSAVGASVPRSEVGFTVVLRASGVSAVAASSLAAALSELSPAAARVEVVGAVVEAAVVGAVVEAGLELNSALFVTGRAISGNEPTFSGFEASSVFLVSAVATLFSVAAGVAAASVFSVAEAAVSEVAAAVPERSIFGTDPPSPYALEAAGASA